MSLIPSTVVPVSVACKAIHITDELQRSDVISRVDIPYRITSDVSLILGGPSDSDDPKDPSRHKYIDHHVQIQMSTRI